MRRKILLIGGGGLLFGIVLLLSVVMGAPGQASAAAGLTAKEQLGKALFFDQNLSRNRNQACAACHAPEVGWTGPDRAINRGGAVYEGSVHGLFGNRKPPAASYAGDSGLLHFDGETWVGGMFWDGRATGARLGDPLAEQAQGPFLNPLEQALPDATAVCTTIQQSSYASRFEQVWGSGALDCSPAKVETTYEYVARSIAAYERSSEVSAFTSKYDYYLKGLAKLTPEEQRGLKLFEGKAQCANCHVSQPDDSGNPPLFTDFTYDNLGLPKNPQNPFYHMPPAINPLGERWVDYGLGGYLKAAGYPKSVYKLELGKFKVPTLRNVDKRPNGSVVKAYGHNGYFKSLEEIVHFYNTRDVPDAGWRGKPWPAPEVARNVNTEELGNLGLSPADERALVAFLKTLSDGYRP